ncbi:MAG: twin-arginine translocase TatA/TatE family subunit [Acidobacteriaceae bacterium]|nr:twin-arginine translocase TatA/TatE family subunit [Acidobacteriaceae bacterium]
MPGFEDSAVIVLLALLLFGPKKLPVLARQLGKLMADFRRASSEFRVQMEDELRVSEQAERQKQIASSPASTPNSGEVPNALPSSEQLRAAEVVYAEQELPLIDSPTETSASPVESAAENSNESTPAGEPDQPVALLQTASRPTTDSTENPPVAAADAPAAASAQETEVLHG